MHGGECTVAPSSIRLEEHSGRLQSMTKQEIDSSEGVLAPRQCERLKAELPFHLGGLDSMGRFFEDSIVTRDFSVCGGSFASIYPIQVGSTLKLAGSTGFLSLIRIAWSRQGSQNSRNYGFWFVQPLEE